MCFKTTELSVGANLPSVAGAEHGVVLLLLGETQ